jgi:hypothetical protein
MKRRYQSWMICRPTPPKRRLRFASVRHRQAIESEDEASNRRLCWNGPTPEDRRNNSLLEVGSAAPCKRSRLQWSIICLKREPHESPSARSGSSDGTSGFAGNSKAVSPDAYDRIAAACIHIGPTLKPSQLEGTWIRTYINGHCDSRRWCQD